MNLIKTKIYILFCLFIGIASCKTTITKTKNPVFNDAIKVENELASLITPEKINLAGRETITNQTSTSQLEVSITNARNVPALEDEMKALGKLIATCIKRNLKDTAQFETYTVLFVTKVDSSGVTKRKWKGNIFSSAEL
jgi:hypothetical protein